VYFNEIIKCEMPTHEFVSMSVYVFSLSLNKNLKKLKFIE
jgi:hypothetical protein